MAIPLLIQEPSNQTLNQAGNLPHLRSKDLKLEHELPRAEKIVQNSPISQFPFLCIFVICKPFGGSNNFVDFHLKGCTVEEKCKNSITGSNVALLPPWLPKK